jgi:TonB-linked SusC/RagA family outer membrane protein
MIMKSTIIKNILQMPSLRFAFCAFVLGVSCQTYAQDDTAEEVAEETETQIKQPVRKTVYKQYPTVSLKGKVVDQATKKPLAGIQLQALGNRRYTSMTGDDGTFVIKVPVFTTSLYVHAPQYMSQQVGVVAGDSTQQIEIKMLSDAYLPMYGTGTVYTAQNSFTAAARGASVEREIGNKLGADMRTIQRSAVEDGGASMFIRGLNSITSNAQPLVAIDGIEQDMQRNRASLHDGQFSNILANLSPDDIEKVTVLKNATALYGARGANGVVLIETKRGHSMATRIDANISVGTSLIPQLPSMMNAAQYRNYATEMLGTVSSITQKEIMFRFLNDDPNGYYYNTYHNDTDWSDYVYRNAMTQNYGINVQGGDDIGMYNLSLGYMTAEGNVEEASFDRMNVRFNTDIKVYWNLSTKFDLSISRTNNQVYDDGFPYDFTAGTITSPTALALIKAPIISPYQYNKVIGGFSDLLSSYDDIYSQLENNNQYSLANPVSILRNANGDNKNKAENTYFSVKLEPTLRLSDDFSLTASLSYTLIRGAQRYYRPYYGVPSFEISDLGTVTSMTMSMFSKQNNMAGNVHLDFSHQYGAHSLAAFVGARYNYFSYDNSNLSTEYNSITNDKNAALSSSTGYQRILGVNDVWKVLQWYGNVDYNYMNRYFATLSLMAEANSRFGENADGMKLFGTQWAVFPSVQLGWVATNEKWFPKHIGIDYLRFNAGFDISGNDDISNYAARTSHTPVKFNGRATGNQLTNIGNDKIQWETTKKWNVGMQAHLLNNRLGVAFDYFVHNTSNLLMLKSFTTPIGGINKYWSNGGELKNTGFEASLSVKPVVTKDWRVEAGVSVGHYKNEVTALPDGSFTTSAYGDNNILTAVGQPVAVFYGYQTAGIFATDQEAASAYTTASGASDYLYMENQAGMKNAFKAGDVHFVDRNGDGIIDDGDKTIIGDPNPDIYGNIFAKINWKDITLSLGFNYSLGNDVYNYQRSILNSGSTFYNQQVAEANHWRYEGQVTDLPRLAYGDPLGNNRFSDRWIEDGSYLRLKTLNLAYRVPVPGAWTWLQGLTLWAEAQNLFTLTRYLGSDPEFSIGNSVYYQGIDCGNLAQGRSFTLGVKINL